MMLDGSQWLLVLSPLWPMLLVAALLVPRFRITAQRLVSTAALPALLTALLPSTSLELELPWLLLGVVLGMDELSRTFLLFSAILWTVGGMALPKEGRSRFSAWFLLTMTGNFALLLAQDIPFFFFAYALMSLASFGLVIHQQTRQARRAAKVYLVFAVLGEMVLLVALVMVAHNAETLDLAFVMERTPQPLLMTLLLLGFGIKAGTPLLHLALPRPTLRPRWRLPCRWRERCYISGLYGWMRFLPLGQVAVPLWSVIFLVVGIIAVFYGIAVGLTQREAKPLLAYSSISQMGLMTLGLGIGLGSPEDWPLLQSVLLLFALHHALAKGALFLGLGLQGRARLGLWLPALALAGLPYTGGALVKGLLKAELHLLPDTWSGLTEWVLALGSVGTSLLLARFLYLALRPGSADEPSSPVAWWLLLSSMLLLPWIWPLPVERFSPFWSALWPVLLGAGLAWLVYRGLFSRLLEKVPAIPPGDLLVLGERLLQPILPRPHARHPEHKQEHDAVLQPRATPRLIARPEQLLGVWQVAIGLLLLIVLGIFWLAAGNF